MSRSSSGGDFNTWVNLPAASQELLYPRRRDIWLLLGFPKHFKLSTSCDGYVVFVIVTLPLWCWILCVFSSWNHMLQKNLIIEECNIHFKACWCIKCIATIDALHCSTYNNCYTLLYITHLYTFILLFGDQMIMI